MSGSRSVLVLDGELRHAIDIVRSLGSHGFVVGVASRMARPPARYSRHVSAFHRVPCTGREEQLGWLEELLRRRRYDVVVAAGLNGMATLAAGRERLAELTRFAVPPQGAFDVAEDKAETVRLAERLGVPVPQTCMPAGPSDLETCRELQFPVAVKARGEQGHFGYASGVRELERVFAALAGEVPEQAAKGHWPIVQEYVPGRGHGFYALMDHGELRAAFMHERLREVPPSGGPSSLARGYSNERLQELGLRLLQALDWTGVAMVEFKRDERDGDFKLIEINPKFWGSLGLAIHAGVDFPYLLVKMALREPFDPVSAPVEGVTYQWLTMDMAHAWAAGRPWLWLEPIVCGVPNDFRVHDPLPNAVLFAERLVDVARGGRRVRSVGTPPGRPSDDEPVASGREELVLDLHIHSRHSYDGLMSPQQILAAARMRGLDVIAVTDHGTIAGGLETARLSSGRPFVVVGAEIATEVGDIVGLFLTREIHSRRSEAVIAEIHDQGGIAVLPHPSRGHGTVSAQTLVLLDGIETVNGRSRTADGAYVAEAFGDAHGLATVGGSDAHLPWEIGRAVTCVSLPALETEALKEELVQGRCRALSRAQRRSESAVLLSKTWKHLRRALSCSGASVLSEADEEHLGRLLALNHPARFWGVDGRFSEDEWQSAAARASRLLPGSPLTIAPRDPCSSVLRHVLGEAQFGPERYRLSAARSVYYGAVRPRLPARARPVLRRLTQAGAARESLLEWPTEARYVEYQGEVLRLVTEASGGEAVQQRPFWPDGHSWALVLTHDVEAEDGRDFVREVAKLEKDLGFRSSFNFVADDYAVDEELLDELRTDGFEIGVHGLHHDGRLFSSRAAFDDQVEQINARLAEWGAVGFRSPMTHRNPRWMQALAIEYDSSFFDSDPFEPMPGGVMTVWPYMLGRFVELPYTLAQDHTLLETLRETTPRLWLEKVDFIRRHGGMALLITHPDYLRRKERLLVYEAFLREMSRADDCWQTLPRTVAQWWRARAAGGSRLGDEGLPVEDKSS